MSYSITVRGKTKHEVTEKARAALAAQLGQMREHARDREAAHASIAGHVAATDEPLEGNEVVVEAHGHLTGHWANGGLAHVTGANHQVRVYHAPASASA